MRLAVLSLFAACALVSSANAAEQQCGELANAFGPFDYRSDKNRLPIVESYHFDAGTEKLVRGKSGALGADIDYTLRAFPNHPRALMAMQRLAERSKTDKPPHANYTINCYYERAVRFRPDDGVVRMLYANFLARRGAADEAIKHLEAAEKALGASANLHYNMGLVYADLKQYDKALAHAHQAYQLGFNLPGLKAKLQRAGQWREPAGVESAKRQTPASTPSQVESRSPGDSSAESATANTSTTAKP
jgi:tetratricopeptide (TPR) repeat protein